MGEISSQGRGRGAAQWGRGTATGDLVPGMIRLLSSASSRLVGSVLSHAGHGGRGIARPYHHRLAI